MKKNQKILGYLYQFLLLCLVILNLTARESYANAWSPEGAFSAVDRALHTQNYKLWLDNLEGSALDHFGSRDWFRYLSTEVRETEWKLWTVYPLVGTVENGVEIRHFSVGYKIYPKAFPSEEFNVTLGVRCRPRTQGPIKLWSCKVSNLLWLQSGAEPPKAFQDVVPEHPIYWDRIAMAEDRTFLQLNHPEASRYCAERGMRLPTARELARLAEQDGGLGPIESEFWRHDLMDSLVQKEIQKNRKKSLDAISYRDARGHAVIDFYQNRVQQNYVKDTLNGILNIHLWSSTSVPYASFYKRTLNLKTGVVQFADEANARRSGIRCVSEKPIAIPLQYTACLQMTPEQRATLGFRCQTSSGALFERVQKQGFGEAWMGPDHLIWSDFLDKFRPETPTYSFFNVQDAISACEAIHGRLPTRKELIDNSANQIIEVLPHMKGLIFWSSTLETRDKMAYYFLDGSYGTVGFELPNFEEAARCVF